MHPAEHAAQLPPLLHRHQTGDLLVSSIAVKRNTTGNLYELWVGCDWRARDLLPFKLKKKSSGFQLWREQSERKPQFEYLLHGSNTEESLTYSNSLFLVDSLINGKLSVFNSEIRNRYQIISFPTNSTNCFHIWFQCYNGSSGIMYIYSLLPVSIRHGRRLITNCRMMSGPAWRHPVTWRHEFCFIRRHFWLWRQKATMFGGERIWRGAGMDVTDTQTGHVVRDFYNYKVPSYAAFYLCWMEPLFTTSCCITQHVKTITIKLILFHHHGQHLCYYRKSLTVLFVLCEEPSASQPLMLDDDSQ